MNQRLGEERRNNFGTLMKIIEYNKAVDIIVEFQDKHKYRRRTNYQAFLKGDVRNPYDKTVHGVGYLGVGKYKTKEGKRNTLAGKAWRSMMERCYSEDFKKKHPNYLNSTVCDEWHNFQNFAEWFYMNYYEVPGERMEIENNILLKGNTEYCPEYSIIAPQRINTLFVKMNGSRDRGKCCVGVYKKGNGYCSQCSYIENHKYKRIQKYFSTEEEAFKFYKETKENYIKQVADEYYGLIPRELWKAMWEYEIDIDD